MRIVKCAAGMAGFGFLVYACPWRTQPVVVPKVGSASLPVHSELPAPKSRQLETQNPPVRPSGQPGPRKPDLAEMQPETQQYMPSKEVCSDAQTLSLRTVELWSPVLAGLTGLVLDNLACCAALEGIGTKPRDETETMLERLAMMAIAYARAYQPNPGDDWPELSKDEERRQKPQELVECVEELSSAEWLPGCVQLASLYSRINQVDTTKFYLLCSVVASQAVCGPAPETKPAKSSEDTDCPMPAAGVAPELPTTYPGVAPNSIPEDRPVKDQPDAQLPSTGSPVVPSARGSAADAEMLSVQECTTGGLLTTPSDADCSNSSRRELQRLVLPQEVVAAGGLDCLSVCHRSTTTALVLLEDFNMLPGKMTRGDGWCFCPSRMNLDRRSCVLTALADGSMIAAHLEDCKPQSLVLKPIISALDAIESATNSKSLMCAFHGTEKERWRNGVVPLSHIHLLVDARDNMREQFGDDTKFNLECKRDDMTLEYLHGFLDEARWYELPANYSKSLPAHLRDDRKAKHECEPEGNFDEARRGYELPGDHSAMLPAHLRDDKDRR